MQIFSNVSLWWILPFAIVAYAIGYFVYHKNQSEWNASLSTKQRNVLITLRSISVFLLLVACLGILFQYNSKKILKPILAVGIDNSTSMLNYDDSLIVKKETDAFLKKMHEQLNGKYTIQTYTAAGNTEILKENWKFDQTKTNLFEGLEGIKNINKGQNLAAILLLSDGNINEGNLPQFAINELLQTAVYSIGVGDTLFKADQLIKNSITNDRVMLGNNFLINADIQINGFPNETTSVRLIHKGNVIAQQEVKVGNERSAYKSVSFEVEAKNVGVQAYTIEIQHKKGEHTHLNNTKTCYVQVIDGRNKILLLADGPHPDMKALERALERDENNKVEVHLLSNWDRKLEDVTLLVVHSPGNVVNNEMAKFIGNTAVSKLYILGTNADNNFFKAYGSPISLPEGKQFDDVTGVINVDFSLFQIQPQWEQALKKWTPLKVKYGKTILPQSAQAFLFQKVGPVIKKEPLIAFTEHHSPQGKSKIGILSGEGIWRWRMTEYAQNTNTDVFDELFGKIAQYLAVKQNSERFSVKGPKQLTNFDDVLFVASVFNAAFERVEKQKVDFELLQEGKELRKLTFSEKDSTYLLNLGKINPGIYEWKASTIIDGKKTIKKGELIIAENQIEQMDVTANHQVLIQLAAVGNGQFSTLKNADKIIEDLKNRTDLSSKSVATLEWKALLSFFWFFCAIVVFLSSEWFLRRFWGNY